MFDSLKNKGFEIEFTSHAQAILATDFPTAVAELEKALAELSIPIEEIIGSGGGETKGTQRLRRSLAALGWVTTNFVLEKSINGVARESITHKIDHVRTLEAGVIALEIEWNNKDPFFDRDLENMKRLHGEGAISVGVIVTRGSTLQSQLRQFVERFAEGRGIGKLEDLQGLGLNPTPRQRAQVVKAMGNPRGSMAFREAWAAQFVADKFGQATTHWRKLEDRIQRGVGNPCPLVLIGFPANIVTFGGPNASLEAPDDDDPEA